MSLNDSLDSAEGPNLLTSDALGRSGPGDPTPTVVWRDWASTGLTDIHHQGMAPERISKMETMERKKPRPRRSFTPEFKAEIVELCQHGDRSISQVARDFDPGETAVRAWVHQADTDAGTLASSTWTDR